MASIEIIMIYHQSASGYGTEILGNGYLKLYLTLNTFQPCTLAHQHLEFIYSQQAACTGFTMDYCEH